VARAARGITVFVVALAVGIGAAAAGATTSTTASTPSTTVAPVPTTVAILPPPPLFPLGDDFGRLIRVHRDEGLAALSVANRDITTSTQQLASAAEHVKIAQSALRQARVNVHLVARRLVKIHDQIKVLAVEAYMAGSSGQITGALSSLTSAHDVVELGRNMTFANSAHVRMQDLVEYERHQQTIAAATLDAATKTLGETLGRQRAAGASLAGGQQRRAAATAEIEQAARDLQRFFDTANTSASPIMGPSRLTAGDLVAYIDSLHLNPAPHLTVPMPTLAEMYISEGNAEGIRGDVAFAQSILETGAFTFPGHGLLDPVDNNFAGIDACDSCKHGDKFESALAGVRAQMQLLRVYADPTLNKITDFAHPVALLHEPRLRTTGFARTWYALGGRWATGPNYGFHIYDIYLQMVAVSRRKAGI
jgi:hypothetical protein